MLYPFVFQPLFKERVWGGRNLASLYGKPLPAAGLIGESWEISDRPGDVSMVANGPLAGRDLRWLMEHHRDELLGRAAAQHGRFPLLVKILDAQATLSLQVHPPPVRAVQLGGEPKTEMWFVADAKPGAELFVGLRCGVTRAEFERRIADGSVAECFHRLPVRKGDAMFLPSGRVHALGAGLVIFEIQQNSDTTFRVFDWNRLGTDGKPRTLHIADSLASIDFNDFEPELLSARSVKKNAIEIWELVHDPLFRVERYILSANQTFSLPEGIMHILGVLSGNLIITAAGRKLRLAPGTFCLIPASVPDVRVESQDRAEFLRVQANTGS